VDDFSRELKVEFINEALGNLEESEGAFLELETSTQNGPLLDRIFRLAHNLKGGSRAVGFGDVAAFTHELENLVLKIQKGGVSLTPDVISTLLRSNDRLIEMLSGLKEDLEERFDCSDLIQQIQDLVSGSNQGSPSPQVSSVTPDDAVVESSTDGSAADENFSLNSVPQSLFGNEPPPPAPDAAAFFRDEYQKGYAQGHKEADHKATELISVAPLQKATLPLSKESQAQENEPAPATSILSAPHPVAEKSDSAASQRSSGPDLEVIRVNLQKIDALNDLVGELIVLQSVVLSQTESAGSRKLFASTTAVSKLAKTIQEISMGFRMLPAKPLVQKLQRAVRDTAKAVEKSVELRVEGETIEIDKSVLDRLTDPLIHILRNAVDHGIEEPQQRQKNGKAATGQIVLSFENKGNNLVITIKDDGNGIDPDVIRRKAISKNLISSEQSLTEKQVLNLIFLPGFSTKDVTSEISGRGVGMDVVKTNVEQIGGAVEITSRIGEGSCFRLQIPLSLSVIDGLIVRTKSGRYVMPLSQIEQTVNLKSNRVHVDRSGMMPCFKLRGQLVPLVDLDQVIGSRSSEIQSGEDAKSPALIVQVEGRLAALQVQEILKSQQIVVKPLNGEFSTQKGWIGSCVLGDGMPTLILNPTDLLAGKLRFELYENQQIQTPDERRKAAG
jgi:two-component system chemotaxis sensor kinase CheA